jgi:serine/threonine protein phosphatase PrpC
MKRPGTRLPPTATRLIATGAGLSHRGHVREVNEDAILTDPTGALWAVADGMGGHGHGDLAADLVIDAFARLPHGGGGRSLLQDAFASAHAEVRRRARAEGFGPIGATLVALLVEGDRATLAWAGDSRGYLWRQGRLERLTRDHSLVQDLVDRGELDAVAAEHHPQAHVVTRAVGAADRLEPAFREVALHSGDRLLLCSDGLTRCVPEPEIAALLAAAPDPPRACRDLIEAALARGAPDNVSAIVVRIDAAEAP